MAQVRAVYSVPFSADVNVVNVTETVVATLPGIDAFNAQSIMRLLSWVQFTPGATHTSVTPRIRRTDINGAVVGEANARTFAAAGAQILEVSLLTEDQPGDVASQAYVLTLQQAGGAGNLTALQGYLMAIVT